MTSIKTDLHSNTHTYKQSRRLIGCVCVNKDEKAVVHRSSMCDSRERGETSKVKVLVQILLKFPMML